MSALQPDLHPMDLVQHYQQLRFHRLINASNQEINHDATEWDKQNTKDPAREKPTSLELKVADALELATSSARSIAKQLSPKQVSEEVESTFGTTQALQEITDYLDKVIYSTRFHRQAPVFLFDLFSHKTAFNCLYNNSVQDFRISDTLAELLDLQKIIHKACEQNKAKSPHNEGLEHNSPYYDSTMDHISHTINSLIRLWHCRHNNYQPSSLPDDINQAYLD